jgi:hypothetical protein
MAQDRVNRCREALLSSIATHRALRHLNKCRFGNHLDDFLEEQEAERISEAYRLREKLQNHYDTQNDTELFKKLQADNGRIYYAYLQGRWLKQKPDDLHTWFELSPHVVTEQDGQKTMHVAITLVKKHGEDVTYIGVSPLRLN